MAVEAKKRKIAIETMCNHNCEEFSVISYNVNGLSDEYSYVIERCREISRLVSNESPDVIFFQETTNETCLLYSTFLRPYGYNLVSSQQSVQSIIFTVAFSRHIGVCQRAKFDGAATSVMGRDLLKYELLINNRKCHFLSGHLESLGESSKIRVAQLEEALNFIGKFEGPAVLVGDLNIRSKEADGIFKKLKKRSKDCAELFRIVDCWEFLGKVDMNKNTWICAEPSLSHIQARYDRVYCNGCFITPVEFRLIGKDVMLSPVLTTPSDHFGIYVKFIVETERNDCCNDKGSCVGNVSSSISGSNDDKSKIVGSLYSSDHNDSNADNHNHNYDNDQSYSEKCHQNLNSISSQVQSNNSCHEISLTNFSESENFLSRVPLITPIYSGRQISGDGLISSNGRISSDGRITRVNKGISCPDNVMEYSGYGDKDTDEIKRDEESNKKRKHEDIVGVEIASRKQLMALAAMKRLLACEASEPSSESANSSSILPLVPCMRNISNQKSYENQIVNDSNADFSPTIIIDISDSPSVLCHANIHSSFKSDFNINSHSNQEIISLIDD